MLFGFLVFDGYSNMVLASAVEPLRAARDLAGPDTFGWRLLSPDGREARSSSDLVLRCDGGPADIAGLDALFVVAGYGAREHASARIVKALQLAARKVPVLGGVDGGGWILAAAGLLDGCRATVHWQDVAQFAEAHLDVEAVADRYVVDGNRITAGGASSVVELMLRLISDRAGGALAFDVANLFAQDVRSRAPEGAALAARAPQLLKAVAVMRGSIEQPLSLPDLSAGAAVSPRTLARLFEREFGTSPGRYYHRIRLEAARAMAEETALSAGEIAARTGFSSSACLSRAFRAVFGRTLRATRRKPRGHLAQRT